MVAEDIAPSSAPSKVFNIYSTDVSGFNETSSIVGHLPSNPDPAKYDRCHSSNGTTTTIVLLNV
ncbi:MAG: hypothetical protein WBZ36_18085 [Candidatus Nitrosopolaris sp.]